MVFPLFPTFLSFRFKMNMKQKLEKKKSPIILNVNLYF